MFLLVGPLTHEKPYVQFPFAGIQKTLPIGTILLYATYSSNACRKYFGGGCRTRSLLLEKLSKCPRKRWKVATFINFKFITKILTIK